MKRAAAKPPPVSLGASQHAVFELARDLLLVFKPRGHREDAHSHAHGQRLRVLRGRLLVRIAEHTHLVTPKSGPLIVRAACHHETRAREDTWLVVEKIAHRSAKEADR